MRAVEEHNDEQNGQESPPAMGRLALAAVLTTVGLGALAMLVLAAASVVFR